MKKIGILTYQKSFNYGAMLQVYASQKVIDKFGYEGYIVNYENDEEKKENKLFSYRKDKKIIENIKNFIRNVFFDSYRIRKNNFNDFGNRLRKTSKVNSTEEIEEKLSDKIDIFVAGSDQIWNPAITGSEFEKAFLLDFNAKKKISYASSAGSHLYNDEEIKYIKKALKDFKHISVRECFLKDQLEKAGISNVKVVLDPTLLLTSKEWREDCYDESILKEVPNKFILVYLLEPYNEFCANIILKLKNKFNLPIVYIGFTNRKKKNIDINLTNVTPERFVTLIDHAECIVTDSFHGNAFAVNMKTNLYSILNPSNPKRVENFLSNLDLKTRIITDEKDIDNIPFDVKYVKAEEKLSIERRESIEYLINALSGKETK